MDKSFITLASGANVIKLFVRNLRIFIISLSVSPCQAFPAKSNKHSSLVWSSVNHGPKKFYNIGPWSPISKIKSIVVAQW